MKKITSLFILLILPTIIIFAQETEKAPQPASSSLAIGPKASWDTKIVDIGKVDFNSKTVAEFTLSNTGNEPLFITYADASCGCTDLKYSDAPILPGRNTKLSVTYNGSGDGDFMKTITITTNAETDRTILQIKGNVVKK